MISKTPSPPYYAVIFTSVLKNDDPKYHQMSELLVKLAKQQEGFLGIESARNEVGISVSYWKDLKSISRWKNNVEHIAAQRKGISDWYSNYYTRIALVEKDYGSIK